MPKRIDWFKLHSLIEKEKKNGLKIVAAGLDHDGDSWTTVWIDYDGYVNTGKGCFASEDDIPRVTFLYDKDRSEEHTSELQSRENLVCRLLLEKKKKK